MKIREIENYGFKILNEKAKDGSMTVYAKFSEAEKRNQNSRIYPLEILTREVDRVQSKIAGGQFLGQADHGDSPATFLKDVSHIVTGLEMKGNEGFATIKILNTDAGKNVQEIIRGKGRVGISTRSVGTVSATGIVQKDLRLLSLDLVANPSVKDATIGKENILEGLDFEEDNLDAQRQKDLEEAINDLEKESYLSALEGGFTGSREEYEALCGGNLREMVGLPEKEGGKTSVQKLTEEQVKDRTYSYYQEAVASGFKGTFPEWKETYPQLVETASRGEKISEQKKEPFKSSATWEEIRGSGFKGSMDEYKEQFPNITIRPILSQKPVVETLEEEAQRIFEGLKKDNPNSSLTLESVIQMLEKEGEGKRARKERELAAFRVSRSLAGSGSAPSPEQLKRMVDEEVEIIRERKAEKKRKNWAAYKRLLSD